MKKKCPRLFPKLDGIDLIQKLVLFNQLEILKVEESFVLSFVNGGDVKKRGSLSLRR